MFIDSTMFESQKWFCPCLKRGDKEVGLALVCKAQGGLCKYKHCPFVHWARSLLGDEILTYETNKGDSTDASGSRAS